MSAIELKRVKKRSGRYQNFDKERIIISITKAMDSVGKLNEQVANGIADRVVEQLCATIKRRVPTVDEIQDLTETVLLEYDLFDVAKSYILYREQRSQARDIEETIDKDLVSEYIKKDDWEIKENANHAFSLSSLNNYISSNIVKKYWLNKVYTKEIRDVHNSGAIHIHDLSCLAPYCTGWDLIEFLTEGFGGIENKVNSSSPKHFSTALGQMVNFIYTVQNEVAGAVGFSNFDTILSQYIAKDKLSYNQVKQSIQEFIYNLNVPTRTASQTPFSNLSFDLVCPEHLKRMPTILDNTKCYGDYQKEMDMIVKAFCEVMYNGDRANRVFTFPIPTINIDKDFDWDNANYEWLWKITAKFGIPYFGNFISTGKNKDETRSFCCRLSLNKKEIQKRGGGIFNSDPLTGSMGVCTINIPQLAYLSNKDTSLFYKKLDDLLDVCKMALEIKRKTIEDLTDNDLYPYCKFWLKNIKKKTGKYWDNHFSTIGILGFSEALKILGVSEDIGDEVGIKFAKETLEYIQNKCLEFQKETGNLYNFEAVPGESTATRFFKMDKKNYPDIVKSIGDKGYYSNSTMLPVQYTDDIYMALKKQEELQSLYSGGSVFHAFLGEQIKDYTMVPKLLKAILTKFKVPYLSLTPTFSICKNHGYLNGEQYKCPKCEESTEVYSRVVGYLRPVSHFNEGKKEEFEDRKIYKV